MPQLRRLDLSNNGLIATVPLLGGTLEYLDLSGNALSGSLPTHLSGLSRLTSLRMACNQLSGCCDNRLRDLISQVAVCDLAYNPFAATKGLLPPWLFSDGHGCKADRALPPGPAKNPC